MAQPYEHNQAGKVVIYTILAAAAFVVIPRHSRRQ